MKPRSAAESTLLKGLVLMLVLLLTMYIYAMVKYSLPGTLLRYAFPSIIFLNLLLLGILLGSERTWPWNKRLINTGAVLDENAHGNMLQTETGQKEKIFRLLVESNDEIIALLNEKLQVVYRNSAAARITGWTNQAYETTATGWYIHPDEEATVKAALTLLLGSAAISIPITTRVKHKNGHAIWLSGTVTNRIAEPGIAAIVVNLRDITQQQETDQKLIKAKRLYLFISQVNKMLVRVKDEQTLFSDACQIAVDTGKFRMAWIGIIDQQTKNLQPVTYAGEEDGYLAKINISPLSNTPAGRGPTGTALREGKFVFCNNIEQAPEMAPWREAAMGRGYLSSISLPIIKSGNIAGAFTLYADTVNFFNEEEIELLQEVTSDISFALEIFEKDKRRAIAVEAQLHSKQRYQTLTEIAPAGIFHTDAFGSTTYVNPRWCQISGMSATAALGNGWLNAVHQDDRQSVTSGWNTATQESNLSFSEYRFLRPDGNISWVLGQAIPERDTQNQIIGYVGIITDITERKETQQKIEKIYKEKETVLNRINDAMVSVDNDWRYTFLNDAALATHPLGKEETIGRIIWDVHPEMKGTIFWDNYHKAMNERKVVEFENFYTPLNTWFFVKVYPSHDGLTIIYRDITDRKKNEQRIITSELRLRKAQEIGKMGYWQQDLASNMVWASKEAMRIYGFPYEEGELEKEKIAACIIDVEKVRDAAINLVEHGLEYKIEIRINPADGTAMKYISSQAELERNEQGQPIRIVGTLQDISERIKAKNDIIKEKNLSDSIINSLPGIFYLYNEDRKFLRWNRNFEKISQYTAGEIRQMHPLDFFDPEDHALVSEKISNTFQAGEDHVQVNFLLKTKDKIPYYFTGKKIVYEGSTCLAGVGIDFTERKTAQLKIKETTEQLRHLTAHLQRIREEERKRIGREIHDELGQQLTAIKMDIAWIDKKIPEDTTALKNKLKNVIALLDGSNQSIRRILSELRPAILDDYGLVDAIDWIGKQLTENTGIALSFSCTATDTRLPEPVATCIFRVYQEALTNIIRHSAASKVNTSMAIAEGMVTVRIEDNGRGFDPLAVQNNRSFGILGMKERVLSLGGILELTAAPGRGTSIMIELPATI